MAATASPNEGAAYIDSDTLDMLGGFIKGRDGNDIIFGINRHRAWQIVRGCARRAGLPDLVNPDTGKVRGVSPHRLRDAFAVHAVKLDDSGGGLRLLQEHLGHASFNTMARYRKVAGEEHREWYQKLWPRTQEKIVHPCNRPFLVGCKTASVKDARPKTASTTKGQLLTVIPAKAGIHIGAEIDSRLRGNDIGERLYD